MTLLKQWIVKMVNVMELQKVLELDVRVVFQMQADYIVLITDNL
jgi:hypothetical protein